MFEPRGTTATRNTASTQLGAGAVRLSDGELFRWQHRNREQTIGHAIHQLRLSGNLENFRTLSAEQPSAYLGRYPFLDTDIYKTLEGLAYEIARENDDASEGAKFFEEAVGLIQGAQAEDGYLNTFYQNPNVEGEPWSDLAWGHEMYNLGHLIQAAVAAKRQLGDSRLLGVATRFADLVVSKYGENGEPVVCGHPEVEMALVELYRETGNADYLRQAQLFVDRRGHGTVELKTFTSEYFQDNHPLRDLPSVTGHAVRMTYLAAGATDVAVETGDTELLAQLERLWDDMVATKLYITGGLGSRHSDEAIGDRFELPSERAYSETCAAIATMQWAWRMYMAQGKAKYMDVFETVLYNAYAVGLSTDGKAFFYDNPLQRRADHEQRSGYENGGEELRRAWFGCPCCPPNVIRWVAELQDHIATSSTRGLQLSTYTGSSLKAGGLELEIATEYPWKGLINISVTSAEPGTRELSLRIPGWCKNHVLSINGAVCDAVAKDGWLAVSREFVAGDSLKLSLDMPIQARASHPYLDATRGSAAVVRGPIVFCLEEQDVEADIDDLVITTGALAGAAIQDMQMPFLDGAIGIELDLLKSPPASNELYPVLEQPLPKAAGAGVGAKMVPYMLWGNREVSPMRVWLRLF
ncbi:hypothetical protein CQ018_05505 [Arthrobacter sp. MYb227]|uniref:glycoside hydrolase family 127 protein n=1 Tax=Arthrobacter sp. MYb227 TaxID=1848601 RepID=UPI000CFAD9E8|nr:beta-L-arabinofuranosidase domain-containing protein [Arthrobacter sp. MYb227]PQZ95148.1 hypothetical protein CQ018_05505 [Arthrobacter sp. MYb227]